LDNSKFTYKAIWDTEEIDWSNKPILLDSLMPRFFAGAQFDSTTGLLDVNNTPFLV
jgi:hypothetical protein